MTENGKNTFTVTISINRELAEELELYRTSYGLNRSAFYSLILRDGLSRFHLVDGERMFENKKVVEVLTND